MAWSVLKTGKDPGDDTGSVPLSTDLREDKPSFLLRVKLHIKLNILNTKFVEC